MGRLFWKIFLSFWLTMVVIGVGVGVVVHLYSESRIASFTEVASGRFADLAVAGVAAELEKGGKTAVGSLLQDWPRGRPPVLIVGVDGDDLLDRPVPAAALDQARAQLGDLAQVRGLRRAQAPRREKAWRTQQSMRRASASW